MREHPERHRCVLAACIRAAMLLMDHCPKKSLIVGNLPAEFINPSGESVSSMVFAFESERSISAANSVNVSPVISPASASAVSSEAAGSEIVHNGSLISVSLDLLRVRHFFALNRRILSDSSLHILQMRDALVGLSTRFLQ
jgi:hypothetical protein